MVHPARVGASEKPEGGKGSAESAEVVATVTQGRGGRRVQIHGDLRLRCKKVEVFYLLVLVFPLQERPVGVGV